MIHPTAVVDPKAEVGTDVTIGAFTFIDEDVRIGDGCCIGPGATILRFSTLGANCRVHSGVVIGDVPQDLGFKGGRSYVRIGARCTFREGVTIHRGTQAESITEVGDECYLMANSHVAHNVKLGRQVILANGALLGGYVEVGERVFISGNCLVHQFVRIGRLAMLGGGAGISKDLPPFCTARPMGTNDVLGLNVVGMRRGGLDPAQRSEIRGAFKVLYRSGLNTSQAVSRMREQFQSAPVEELAAFIQSAKRGICAYGGGDEDPETGRDSD